MTGRKKCRKKKKKGESGERITYPKKGDKKRDRDRRPFSGKGHIPRGETNFQEETRKKKKKKAPFPRLSNHVPERESQIVLGKREREGKECEDSFGFAHNEREKKKEGGGEKKLLSIYHLRVGQG